MAQKSSSEYMITTPLSRAKVVIKDSKVVSTSLAWQHLIGMEMQDVRTYCDQNYYKLEKYNREAR
jgi:hypothetical protein